MNEWINGYIGLKGPFALLIFSHSLSHTRTKTFIFFHPVYALLCYVHHRIRLFSETSACFCSLCRNSDNCLPVRLFFSLLSHNRYSRVLFSCPAGRFCRDLFKLGSVAITTMGPLPQLVPPYFWNVLPPSTNSIKFLLVSPPPPLLFSKSISSLGALLTGGSAYEPLTLTEALYKFWIEYNTKALFVSAVHWNCSLQPVVHLTEYRYILGALHK